MIMNKLSELYKDYEYCCDQWIKVLDDASQDRNINIYHILLKVSIKTYDKHNKKLILAHNPKHKGNISLFDTNPVLLGIIEKHFGKMDIVFQANSSIVDPLPRKPDEDLQCNILCDKQQRRTL